jgi:hypothetical protein
MRGFGGLLTKYYLSKVVQRGTMKQGENPHRLVWRDRYTALFCKAQHNEKTKEK